MLLATLAPAAAQPEILEAITEVRGRIMGPAESWQPRAVWLSGPGTANGMNLTVTLRFDDHGRYVTSGRGVIGIAFGFDGTTTWTRDPTGITRTLQLGDGEVERLGQWMINGYWAHPAAPVEVLASRVESDGNEMAITVRLAGSRVWGTLMLDTREWLPREFITNHAGSRQVTRFVAFETLDGRAVPKEIRVETNGREVGWFAIDTGAGGTSVDRSVVRELELPHVGVGQSTGVGGQRNFTIHTTESFEVGPVRIEGLTVTGTETSALSMGLSGGYSGLLGMDVLSHCVIDYDQQNSRIALYDPNTYELPEGKWQSLLSYNRKPTIEMEYEDFTGLFTIDTGKPGAVIIGAMAVSRNRLLDGRKTERGTIGGIGGSVDSETGELEWVVWGGRRFDDVPAAFVVETRGVTADETRDGVIGTDLLRRYRVIFDMTHGRIAFLPN
jgi:hypothetical protein